MLYGSCSPEISIWRAALLAITLLTFSLVSTAKDPLPVEALFGNPTFESPSISARGNELAYFQYHGENQYLVLRAFDNTPPRTLASMSLPDYIFNEIRWAHSDRLFFSGHRKNKNAIKVKHRDIRLFGINTDGSNVSWLGRDWPGDWEYMSRCRIVRENTIVHALPGDPDFALIQFRKPLTAYPAVYRMNIYDGDLVKAQQPSEAPVFQWFLDGAGKARAGYGRRGKKLLILARASADEKLKTISITIPSREYSPRFLGFSSDPNVVYLAALHKGREAVVEYAIDTAEPAGVLFAHPQMDVESLLYDRSGKNLLGVRYIHDHRHLQPLDERFRQHYETIRAQIGNDQAEIDFVDLDLDADTWVLRVQAPTMRPEYLTYSPASRRLTRFSVPRPALSKHQFSATKKFHYSARDNRELHGYVTLPTTSENQPPVPAVVVVHGKPTGWALGRWNRATMSWNPLVQLLASRGFAVVQVNLRGSSGFGIEHETSAYKQYGKLARRDISDALDHLVKENLIDAKRIGIYGSEFGGYLALISPIIEPRVYAAAASHNGVSDIENFVDFDDWYRWYFPQVRKVFGEKKKKDVTLDIYSPLRRAKGMPIPVLLTHGSETNRIPVRQSRKMAKALAKFDKDVTYHEFEGHSETFYTEEARLRFYQLLADFFVEELKP